jgi:NAD+ kinase
MPRRIALLGGSFNPPGLHHRRIAELLATRFDEVRVVPCGPRPDKPGVSEVPGPFRAALCDLTFGGIDRVVVDLFDLESGEFTRNHALERRFSAQAEVWHVVGSDWVVGGAQARSAIHTGWEQGPDLWRSSRFIVLARPGHPVAPGDLPPRAEVIPLELEGSSSDLRARLLQGRDASPFLAPRAARYIARYGLYRGNNPATWSRGTLADLACELASDPANERAREWAAKLQAPCGAPDPGFILALGGDGTMLRAIREHWRRRLPFFGVNAGHFGFLMNAPDAVTAAGFPPPDVIFRQLPLLFVEFEMENGERTSGYAFNDAWLERSTSQSAWLRVSVNDVPRLPKLVADGALVSTAAGSTAYARSMGASPLLANSPAWLLVGSNVQDPAHWKSALLSVESTVEIRSLEPESRPVCAYVDGIEQGRVRSLRARLSRAAAAELVFLANHDMAEKIAAIQFARI